MVHCRDDDKAEKTIDAEQVKQNKGQKVLKRWRRLITDIFRKGRRHYFAHVRSWRNQSE